MENYQQQFYIRELRDRNTRKFAILGDGIVSKIISKFFSDSIILTKRKTNIFTDNMFFHDTIENRLMLHLFGIDFISKDIPVYYYNNITKQTTTVATDGIRYQIAREKMGDTSKPIILSTMTDLKPKFQNLLFNEGHLKRHLQDSCDVIDLFPSAIEEFDDFVRIHFPKGYFDAEYLINTIPQPFFASLIGKSSDEYKYRPLVFVTLFADEDDYMTYSYYDCMWKRIFVKNRQKCIEFDEVDWNEERFNTEFPEYTNYTITRIPYGRISSTEVIDSPRIKHIGRFAQWDHAITTEHIIHKILNLNI